MAHTKGRAEKMKIVDVLNRFEYATQTGMDSWVAMCPMHGDTQHTLLIMLEPDGRMLLHCHAGCTVEEICAAVGLKLSDLMPERAKAKRATGTCAGVWGENAALKVARE